MSEWIKCSERMPKPGVPVLAFVQRQINGHDWTRCIRAMWAAEKTLEAADTEEGIYDEASDRYFVEPGWYENNEFEETHWSVVGPVTHWMPLPKPPAPDAARVYTGEKSGETFNADEVDALLAEAAADDSPMISPERGDSAKEESK